LTDHLRWLIADSVVPVNRWQLAPREPRSAEYVRERDDSLAVVGVVGVASSLLWHVAPEQA
jgi:hypothetical protein